MTIFNWDRPTQNKVSKAIAYMKKDRVCKYCGRHAKIMDRWKIICKDKGCQLRHYKDENDLHK